MPTDTNRFQRVGALSNAQAGSDFEEVVQAYFARTGMRLARDFAVQIGYARKKSHRFDLGGDAPRVLVECKSCTWTAGGNTPSAKLRSFNEAMLHFAVAPSQYRKILMLLKDIRGSESLGSYYVRTQGHLVPDDVEVWELDPMTNTAECLFRS
ncbi:hypothetical protein [Sphingomonas sp.]|uniref:hypothetical protein n=1 Tax=Sphingomonas sp. TaxID=28214 RepID=UPI0038B0EB31